MTTSYKTSLRLKELGVEQSNGEYYWILSESGDHELLHRSDIDVITIYDIRAFTLGELVRELPEISIVKLSGGNYCATCVILSIEESVKFSSSPEEAAGELLAAIKSQELKQKEGM